MVSGNFYSALTKAMIGQEKLSIEMESGLWIPRVKTLDLVLMLKKFIKDFVVDAAAEETKDAAKALIAYWNTPSDKFAYD